MTPQNNLKLERKTLSTRYYWFRFIPLPFMLLFSILYITNTSNWLYLILLLICVSFFILFLRSRRIYYDALNLYVVRFTKETVIPLTDVIKIDRSRTKINGRKYWILTYLTRFKGERKIRYFKSFNFKDFHDSIEAQNPEVSIWKPKFL